MARPEVKASLGQADDCNAAQDYDSLSSMPCRYPRGKISLLNHNKTVLESRVKGNFQVRFGGGLLEKCQMIARSYGNSPAAYPTWYGSEYDGEDLMFGLVVGHEIELGYWSMQELEDVRGPLGLPIERDMHFEPQSLRELMEKHKRERGRINNNSTTKRKL